MNWELQGSNDGSSYTSLHSVSGATWTNYSAEALASNNLNLANEYSFTNTTPYTNYRIAISVNGGHSNYCTMSEVALYKDDTHDLTFSSGPIEKMRITEDGNVGIGTNNPSQKLEVNGYILSLIHISEPTRPY